MRPALVWIAALVALGGDVAGCRGCRSCEDDEREEQEERDKLRDEFWRIEVVLEGHGQVVTERGEIGCTRDAAGQRGPCGPTLFRYKELAAPLLHALPAAGWRFDRWRSLRRPGDGGPGHPDPVPDSDYYVNRFGYADTGETETVTAVFVPVAEAGAPATAPSGTDR